MDDKEYADGITELSRLFVELDRSFSKARDWKEWELMLWIIQIKLDRKPPTPVIKHYNKLIKARQNPEFRECYNAFIKAWDFAIGKWGEFDLWNKSQHERMEVIYNDLR